MDKENAFMLAWLNVTGILTHAATAAPVPPATTFDDIEQAIAKLRVGPTLAVADLLILSPGTWSAIRREKDLQGRYHVAADPSSAETNSAWGVSVIETTACPDGEGWLLDTTKLGRLAVRESLSVRMGFANDDFVRNIVRYVCEERCVLTVERPSAVLHHHPADRCAAGDQDREEVTDPRKRGTTPGVKAAGVTSCSAALTDRNSTRATVNCAPGPLKHYDGTS